MQFGILLDGANSSKVHVGIYNNEQMYRIIG